MRLMVMALFECPRCGTKLYYEGKVHPCKGGKSSDGGGESRPATVRKEGVSYPEDQANLLPSTKLIPSKGEEAPSGPRFGSRIETARVAPSPSEINSGAPKQPRGEPVQIKSAELPGSPNIKRGRPPKPDDAPISRATLYRRKKAQEK